MSLSLCQLEYSSKHRLYCVESVLLCSCAFCDILCYPIYCTEANGRGFGESTVLDKPTNRARQNIATPLYLSIQDIEDNLIQFQVSLALCVSLCSLFVSVNQ